MIKLIIFDLDGVLVSTKDIHFRALNEALGAEGDKYVISHDDHVRQYDGIPTRAKLAKLVTDRGLARDAIERVYTKKQEVTAALLRKEIEYDGRLVLLFKALRARGYMVHLASNSIRDTIDIVLGRLGLVGLVDNVVSNEDVEKPKPAAEMYLLCMLKAEVGPRETMIVEDSYVGREAVFNSGATLCPVNNPEELSLDLLDQYAAEGKAARRRWKDDKLDILIPIAGQGKRFQAAGYSFPKPLINVRDKPMIQVVVENLDMVGRHIFVVLKEHLEKYNLDATLNLIAPGCEIVVQDGYKQGAAVSTLLAKSLINGDRQLVIANSDQWVRWDSSAFMYAMQSSSVDGGILTFQNTHPKWSYAEVDDNGWVARVREKEPISTDATVGVYYFKRGADYVTYAEQMIEKQIQTNGEYYVCPVFNEAIEAGKRIKAWAVDEMRGMGTPEDLRAFLEAAR